MDLFNTRINGHLELDLVPKKPKQEFRLQNRNQRSEPKSGSNEINSHMTLPSCDRYILKLRVCVRVCMCVPV